MKFLTMEQIKNKEYEEKIKKSFLSLKHNPYFQIVQLFNEKNKLLSDPNFMSLVVSTYPSFFAFCDKELINNKEFVKKFYFNKIRNDISKGGVDTSPSSIAYTLPDNLRFDKEIAYLAVKEKGSNFFESLPEDLRDDYYLALESVVTNNYTYNYISDNLKKDKNFFKDCIKYKADIFKFLEKDPISSDVEIVKEFIKINPFNYTFLNKNLKNNLEIIICVLEIEGCMYHKIPEEFKNQEIVIETAIKSYPQLYIDLKSHNIKFNFNNAEKNYLSKKHEILECEGVKDNKEVLISLLKQNEFLYHHLPEKFKMDKDVIREVFTEYNCLLKTLNEELCKDSDFIIELYEKIKDKKWFLEKMPHSAFTPKFIEHAKNNFVNFKNIFRTLNIFDINIIKNVEEEITPDIMYHYKYCEYFLKNPFIFIIKNEYTSRLSTPDTIFLENNEDDKFNIVETQKEINDICSKIEKSINLEENKKILLDVLKKMENILSKKE